MSVRGSQFQYYFLINRPALLTTCQFSRYTETEYGVEKIGTHVFEHVCSCPFPELILPPPFFYLILIPLSQHLAFPLMKCLGPYTVLN